MPPPNNLIGSNPSIATSVQGDELISVEQNGKPTKMTAAQLSSLMAGTSPAAGRQASKGVGLGDSRPATVYSDTAMRSMMATSPLNQANAVLGQRFIIGDNFGKSGDRTDQALARMQQAINTGAGFMYWQAALNDIAQNFPTAGSSGETAFNNTRIAAEIAKAAGMVFIAEAEVGSNNLSAAQVAQVNDYNARLFDYAEQTSHVRVHDARAVVMQPAFADGQVQYRDGYSYDGVHVNARGALYWGESLAALLDKTLPTKVNPIVVNRSSLPANGRRQLLSNPIFATPNGGTLQSGTTGTVPLGFTAAINPTGASAVFSTAADPSGSGNNVNVDTTFSAVGGQVRFSQDVLSANYTPGDIVQAVADVELLDTPDNLAALYLYLVHNTGAGGVSNEMYSLFAPTPAQLTGSIGPNKAKRYTLLTRPYVVQPPAGAGGFMSASLRASAAGTGSCKFLIRSMGVLRRDTYY